MNQQLTWLTKTLGERNREIWRIVPKLNEAISILEMLEDPRKMPHQHQDLLTRYFCLQERAREFLEKYKEG